MLSMGMLPIVTAFRSTSSGLHSPSLELSLGRSSPSLEMSYCGAFYSQTLVHPASGTQNRQGRSLRGNLSHRVKTLVRFVPKDTFVAKRRTVLASHPNNQGMDTLRLGDCKVSEIANVSVFLNQWWHHFCGFVCGFILHLITMVPNGPFCEVSVSSSSQFPTLFPLDADFGCLLLTCVLALQSARM